MNHIRTTRRAALAAGLAAALVPLRAARAAYPERALKWIVPYAAGGGSDVLARLSTDLAAVLREEATAARMHDLGLEALPGSPELFRALLESERRIWVPLIRDLQVTLD
jgi:tripartite-type tricarboxylate transporter receptor subunit TctC